MPRLLLAVIRTTTVDVPTRCPHCDASFVDEAHPALREVTLTEQAFVGSLHLDGEVQHFDVAAGVERHAEDFQPVAYECAVCDAVVAGAGAAALSRSSALRWAVESRESALE